jgi:hypothetical protein
MVVSCNTERETVVLFMNTVYLANTDVCLLVATQTVNKLILTKHS